MGKPLFADRSALGYERCIVMAKTSWTTIVIYSRDDQEVGVAHKVKSPENQP